MKKSRRSTIALATAVLVGGGGVAAAAATGFKDVTGGSDTVDSASSAAPADHRAERAALTSSLRELVNGTHGLERRLGSARHDLAKQLSELREQRAIAASRESSDDSSYSDSYPTGSYPTSPAPSTAPSGDDSYGDDDDSYDDDDDAYDDHGDDDAYEDHGDDDGGDHDDD